MIYPVTDVWIQRAKEFLLQKWQERAVERGRTKVPSDLGGACKFASLFAREIFGGELRGNWDHQFVMVDGQRVDLTEGSPLDSEGRNPYRHDKRFWMNREHRDSLASC